MQPYGQPPPPPGSLAIHTSYPALAFMLALTPPKATIDGHGVPLRWGTNIVPTPPGPHDVQVHVPYLWDVGKARTTVQTGGPAPTDLYYAAPWMTFSPGAMDRQPVKSPGFGLMIGLTVGIFGVMLLCVCASVILPAISASN